MCQVQKAEQGLTLVICPNLEFGYSLFEVEPGAPDHAIDNRGDDALATGFDLCKLQGELFWPISSHTRQRSALPLLFRPDSGTDHLSFRKSSSSTLIHSGLVSSVSQVYTMRLGYLGLTTLLWSFASATILQNGQVKEDPYPGQAPQIALDNSWVNYDAGAPELAYKGRWDSKHVSCTSIASLFQS